MKERHATRKPGIGIISAWLLGVAGLVAVGIAIGRPGLASPKPNQCVTCHQNDEDPDVSKSSKEWLTSIHARNGVECQDCHGGDPMNPDGEASMDTAKGYIGAPAKADIPKLCAKCHSDVVRMRPFRLPTSQFQQYQQSVHGKKLAQGDQNVATCVDCHGAHATLSKNDPNSAVYISNVPKTCGKCHADKTRMAQYKIPTTQLADYTKSVHGLALLQKGDRAAPNCASCHSAHGATPPGRTEVADVCGSCHPEQEKYLKQGPHWQAIADSGGPKCIDCHGNHGISPPTDAMLVDSGEHGCGNCHSEGDKGETVGKQIHNMLTVAKLEMDAAAAQTSLAEAEGMDVADIQADVPAINTTLLEARVILHGLSVNDISGKIQPAREQIAKSLRSAKAMQAASLDRRKTLGLAGVAVLLLAGALFWRWSLIRITWRAGQSGEVPG